MALRAVVTQVKQGFYNHGFEGCGDTSLVPSPSFSRVGGPALHAGKEKEGPGTHCMRMRYKNLMNLIIK